MPLPRMTWRSIGRLTPAAAPIALALLAPVSASAVPAKVAGELGAARAPRGELTRARTIPLPGGATVYRFQQRIGGVDVLNGESVVNDPAGAPPALVADTTHRSLAAPAPPRIDRVRAIRIASANAGVRRLRAPPTAHLVLAPAGGGTLSWDVLIPAARPLADLDVIVNARSGAVLSRRNLLQDLKTGRARIFDPNAVAAHGGDSRLHDNHDHNSPLLTSLRSRVKLRRIEGRQDCLRGKFAKVLLGRGHGKQVCKRSLNWRHVTRAADRFEALMNYYDADREQAYVQSLGFHNVNNRRQLILADNITADNSFYSSATKTIIVGTGGVDDGEDADVIDHEYGHAMQDNQAPGFLSGNSYEAGSVAEGSGDYMAAMMSAQAPRTSNLDDVCIFDWDGQSWGTNFPADHRHCGRRADNPSTVTQERTNPIDCSSPIPLDIHCGGTVWSSALWDLRRALGKDGQRRSIMDRDVIASQFMYTRGETFHKAANALLSADGDLYGGHHHSAIEAEMVDRGLCPPVGC